LFRDAAAGWSFIRERPGLFGLMAYFAIIFFFVSMSNVLMAPMMLAFASFTVIGSIISCAAIGMLVGSLVMGAWGGPKNRVYGVFGFALLQSLSFSLSGLRPNALLVGVASVIESASLPIIHGCNRVIWQVKTPPEIQGRVFATSSMILRSTGPLGFIIAGPLADKVFEPLLVVNGPLAGSLGKVVGVGPGRGIGLMMVVMGLIMTLVTIAAFMNSHIRGIQQELPDCVPDEIIATDAKVSENTVVAHA
ncbi:MAG TPA: MFS transporter, partial [Blastocatellia bacterium]